MALASTRYSFFQRYQFECRQEASLYEEFRRLAKERKWKQGSNSNVYDKAWRECFGASVPVGTKMEDSQRDEKELVNVISRLEDLDLEAKWMKREKKYRKAARKFATYYGMDDEALESWQALCQDCGIEGDLAPITACKKVGMPEVSRTWADVGRL